MTAQATGGSAALTQDQCRERLSRSRRGFLACTERALPTVVPVGLRLRDGKLVVAVHDPGLQDQLAGQVVALSVGRHASALRHGWRVVVRGQIDPNEAEHDGALVLVPFQLDGTVTGRSP